MASSSSLSWLYHVFLSFRGEDMRKGFLGHVLKEFKSKGIIPFIDNEIKRGASVGPELVGEIGQSRVAIYLLSRNYLVFWLSQRSHWLYHVFLSFRGGDVRKGFLSHVRKVLESKGIIAFVDDEMERGQPIDAELIGAIRQARVAVVLLSRNYASSSWCLDELVEIMKCREENQQKAMPIFYEVDPSDVSDLTGDFGKAFDETCVGKEENVKQAWRQALKDVAGLAGYASINCNEADLINKIASDVTVVLGFTPSKDFDDYVGIEARITEIKSKLSLQPEQVKVIVVVGPAGIGKTTIARVLYNQLSPDFPFSTFLENIKGSYEKPCGSDYQLKLRLQKKMLSEIFNQKDIEVRHLGVAQQRLSDKRVLVVLDEVDSWWQLEATAYQREWFGPGSMIIITTEDRKLLKTLRLGIDHIYEMKFPTKDESLQIFCQYAFGQKSPEKGFYELAWEVTGLAGDLPLGLRVMGSYLQGMSRDEWIEALPWLRSTLDREIESTLRFSYYDALTDNERALFLHIACFFDGSTVDSFKRCLANSRLEVNYGLQLLAHKSLLSIEYGNVKMHSLLKQMGREIVKKQSLEERQFLMDSKEISDVLEEDTGTGNVLGIFLNTLFSERRKIQISKSVLDGMNNLQFLKVSYGNLCIPEGLNCLPDKLRLIDWYHCPMRFWPSKFSGKFLVELIMQDNSFETLWKGIKPLQCLKLMDLSVSLCLKEIPDLSKATCLEKLDLHGCKNLLELTSSIGNATKLTTCNLSGCRLLNELPSSIGNLINLEELDLSFCSGLKALSVFSILEKISGCSSLKKLNLGYTVIEEVPSSINTWSCLYRLDMTGCRNLKEFPNVCDSIEELVLCNTGIEEVPPWIEKLFRLRKLVMDGCKKLKKISPNISKLENLELLSLCIGNDDGLFQAVIEWGPKLRDSWRLLSNFSAHYILPICLPMKALTFPISLCFRGNGLKTIPDCISHLSGLSKLDVTGCSQLLALPPLPGSLLSIDAEDCKTLKRIESPFQNPNICLNFAYCFNLNKKARNLIHTSACKYTILPGEEVPAHFPHRATSGSLKISLTPNSLPSSFRFKACILLSKDSNNLEDHNDDDEKDENLLMHVSCRVRGKQNGLTVRYGSNQIHHRPDLYLLREHLYIFEDSFCLNEDFPEAKEAIFSELFCKFKVPHSKLKVEGCGVRLLEVPHCTIDGNVDDDVDEDNDDEDVDESNDDDDDDNDGDEDESADDGEGLIRLVNCLIGCFIHREKKEKSVVLQRENIKRRGDDGEGDEDDEVSDGDDDYVERI